jgi:hypothetical protein
MDPRPEEQAYTPQSLMLYRTFPNILAVINMSTGTTP